MLRRSWRSLDSEPFEVKNVEVGIVDDPSNDVFGEERRLITIGRVGENLKRRKGEDGRIGTIGVGYIRDVNLLFRSEDPTVDECSRSDSVFGFSNRLKVSNVREKAVYELRVGGEEGVVDRLERRTEMSSKER